MPPTLKKNRIIARLDIKGSHLIKGIQFEGLRVLGKAEQFAALYYEEGADELIYMDVVASLYQRNCLFEFVERTAKRSFMPLTVGGGIRSLDDMKALFRAGADKVAINTAAVKDPNLISEAVKAFGSQAIVGSIECFSNSNGVSQVWTDYGRERTNLDVVTWAKEMEARGVGEILLTSIQRDGTGRGFDLEQIKSIEKNISLPLIVSGGAGTRHHVKELLSAHRVEAVSIASLFHYYYAKPDPSLRDRTGNCDFLNEGYGGYRTVPVEPCSIPELKERLRC